MLTIRLNTSDLFQDEPIGQGIDPKASEAKFAYLLTKAVKRAYPKAVIVYSNRTQVDGEPGDNERDAYDVIMDIIGKVYADFKWVVKFSSKHAWRVAWAEAEREELNYSRVKVTPAPRGGKNAANMDGMSKGGWGLWAKALKEAGIKSDAADYWSGKAPTPSTAINAGIAEYISDNAPEGIR